MIYRVQKPYIQKTKNMIAFSGAGSRHLEQYVQLYTAKKSTVLYIFIKAAINQGWEFDHRFFDHSFW